MFRIASRFPREKRVLLSVQTLATASGPTLIIWPCSQLLGVKSRMWHPFRLGLVLARR